MITDAELRELADNPNPVQCEVARLAREWLAERAVALALLRECDSDHIPKTRNMIIDYETHTVQRDPMPCLRDRIDFFLSTH